MANLGVTLGEGMIILWKTKQIPWLLHFLQMTLLQKFIKVNIFQFKPHPNREAEMSWPIYGWP